MKKYNKAGVILLIALCFLCLKTQCTEIQAAEKYKTTNLAQQGKQKVGTTEFYASYSNFTYIYYTIIYIKRQFIIIIVI